MLISLQEIELHKVEFEESFAPGAIELTEEIIQISPVVTHGHAELLEEHHGGKKVVKDIRVVGDLATRVELRCARCLEVVEADLASRFDLLYRPLKAGDAGDEISITEADTEISFYDGSSIMLEDVVKEQILLAVPVKPLCQEACKGLCPHCGLNLNQGECSCATGHTDPRWNALAEIKERLKQ